MATRTKRIIATLIGLAALAVGAWTLIPSKLTGLLPKAAATGDEIIVTPKTMTFGVDAAGILRATSVQNFGAPPEFGNYWQFQIVNLIPEGKQVKSGDQLIGFDAQRVKDDLQKLQIELDQSIKELDKTKAQIDLEKQELLARLAAAENNYEKLRLKQSTDPKVDVINDVEKDKLSLEQARREVEALKDRIEWHKKSSEATYQIIVSKKARAENKVDEINRGMMNFQAKSDREGVVIYKTKWNGERFQVGENVWSGQTILEIPDLNTIIAEAFVPEVDIGKVKVGKRVDITIDAFPGKSYTGSVKSVATLVRPKSWDIPNKILETQISLDQLDASIMRPGMSIKTRIETASIPNCLTVPLKAVRTTLEGSRVKVRIKGSFNEREVKLGDSNGTDVIITEGLKDGDRIAGDFAKAK